MNNQDVENLIKEFNHTIKGLSTALSDLSSRRIVFTWIVSLRLVFLLFLSKLVLEFICTLMTKLNYWHTSVVHYLGPLIP
jgi:diacylglycerol kinase